MTKFNIMSFLISVQKKKIKSKFNINQIINEIRDTGNTLDNLNYNKKYIF